MSNIWKLWCEHWKWAEERHSGDDNDNNRLHSHSLLFSWIEIVSRNNVLRWIDSNDRERTLALTLFSYPTIYFDFGWFQCMRSRCVHLHISRKKNFRCGQGKLNHTQSPGGEKCFNLFIVLLLPIVIITRWFTFFDYFLAVSSPFFVFHYYDYSLFRIDCQRLFVLVCFSHSSLLTSFIFRPFIKKMKWCFILSGNARTV